MEELAQKLQLTPTPYTVPPPQRSLCFELWEEYAMPPHIQAHSTHVAAIAEYIADALVQQGYPLCKESIVISALLHDIAKIYCIENPQYHHNSLGALWILERTGHIAIAQGIYYHNYLEPQHITLPYNILPVIVMYADARVQHDKIVPLEVRYDDLLVRYGTTEKKREHILLVREQARSMEQILSSLLHCSLDDVLAPLY